MGIKAALARKIAMTKVALSVKKPTICVVTGVICMGAATVVACITTAKKLDDVLDKHNAEMEKIRKVKELDEKGELTETKDDPKFVRKATAGVYMKTFGRCMRVYAPSALLMFGGAALIFWGHGIILKRHAIAVTAYQTLQDRFTKYRERVADEVGESREKALFHGTTKKLMPKDGEEGEFKTVEEREVVVDNANNLSAWSFIFDCANAPHTWTRLPGDNYMFLIGMQNWANERLQSKGYLTVNQLLEQLGMTPVVEGQFKGWIYDPSNPERAVVNLGILSMTDDTDPGCYAGGYPDYILNFNVQHDLEAYFAKKKPLKTRSRAKVFARRPSRGERVTA